MTYLWEQLKWKSVIMINLAKMQRNHLLPRPWGGECRKVQALCKTVWFSFSKLKMYLPYNPTITLKTSFHTAASKPMFIAASSVIAKHWKLPKCHSKANSLNKLWSILTTENYTAVRRNELLIHATTRMNLKETVLSEKNQSQNATVGFHVCNYK